MDEKETAHDSQNPWYGPDPGMRPGATTARRQTGHGEGQAGEAPIDTRDAYGNVGAGLADPAVAVDLESEIEEPSGGPYPLPSVIERPHEVTRHGTAPHQPTRDPSLSRAVDREAAGVDVASAGYDRAGEGSATGPIEPDVEQEPPASDELPGGQWGSSG